MGRLVKYFVRNGAGEDGLSFRRTGIWYDNACEVIAIRNHFVYILMKTKET